MNTTYEQRWLKDHYARKYPCCLSGYLLRDGCYIDMVAKSDVDRGAFYRDDHRTISHVYNSPKCESGYNCMIDFMKRGNIRFSPERPGFCLLRKVYPTEEQWDAIEALWRERIYDYEDSGKDLYFEVLNVNGSVLLSTNHLEIFKTYMEENV